MIPEKLKQVLEHEGVVAIATQGTDGPHLVNTWNTYIKVTADGRILLPAGGMHTTEANLKNNSHVKVTVGSREVDGFHGKGTGFLIDGNMEFLNQGAEFDEVKQRFPWARAAVQIKINSAAQTL